MRLYTATLFATTIFVSSFLLFLIQPILAKQILPWFGGSAAVWTTCLVFFQFVLLFGYAYADLVTRKLVARRQAMLHIALLVASLALLPVLPDPGWKPLGNEQPGLRILGLLAATIGLPYFLLSTTGPLVQAWFARAVPGASPYRLFALSNLASMLALLSYPLVFEPWIASATQGRAWSVAYALFVALCAGAAWRGASAKQIVSAPWQAPGHATTDGAQDHTAPPPTARQRLAWFVFPALASVLLLAITNHVCMNIASIPFLWVVPLALYLLSFILCFDGRYRRGPFMLLTGALLIGMAWLLSSSTLTLDLKLAIPVYLFGLFVCCMFCHGELAAMKPAPTYLTGFYLLIAAGGATGALLVGVIAPYVLPGYFELGFGLIAVALLLLLRLRRDVLPYKLAGLIVAVSVGYAVYYQVDHYALATRVMARNFYGSLRTWDTATSDTGEALRKFVHGAILHGEQFLDPKRINDPTTYYSETSGIGRAFTIMSEGNRRVGLIGLGAGTLAAYGQPGDSFRIYEINPLVIGIARGEFSFLKNSAAKVDIVLGDARLNLEREPAQRFDLLVIDAFSGDAIPVHLITREAMAVYLSHLRPGGVLAFHVTNRYLDLAPVVKQIADYYQLGAVLVADDPEGEDTDAYSRTDWVLVSADRVFLANDLLQDEAVTIEPHQWRLWTDDFNNLLQILK